MKSIILSFVIAALMPMPADAQTSADVIIRPGDVLHLRVWPDSTANGSYSVEETGHVALPVLGDIQAAGMRLRDLRTRLRNDYAKILESPVVTLTVLFRVTVLGEVQRPGMYTVDPTHSLFDAIALAGGFTSSARTEAISLHREGKALDVNARNLTPETERVLGTPLQSGDRVIIAKRRSFNTANLFYVLQSLLIAVTLYTQLK